MCKGADNTGSVFIKIKKELKQAGLIPYGTMKSALKNKIKHKINVLQERLLAKTITTFKELISNIGDFKKHFNNEVFLDFTNIAEESDEERRLCYFILAGQRPYCLKLMQYILMGLTKRRPNRSGCCMLLWRR